MRTGWLWMIGAALACCGASPSYGQGSPEAEAVLSMTPLVHGSRVAVSLSVPKDKGLAGVRWYNNDGATVFPQIRLFGGPKASPTEMTAAVQIADCAASVSSGWVDMALPEAICSTAEALWVVFDLPADRQFSGPGAAGGPGFGYRMEAGGPAALLSADGIDWVRLRSDTRLLVEPMLCERVAGMAALEKSGAAESEVGDVAAATGLLPPYPNPGNPTITIPFALEQECGILLNVYDLRGRLVRSLLAEQLGRGSHIAVWDGKDDHGRAAGSGAYFARLLVDEQSFSQRILLVR